MGVSRSGAFRKSQKEKGLCASCAKPPVPGKARCEYHLVESVREARRRRYGLTKEQLSVLESLTECEICGGPANHIDHSHRTGKVRGVLCKHCNFLPGNARDDVTILARAIEYLTERE